MPEKEIVSTLRRCIRDFGYSWPTTCQIVSRMAGRSYTVEELRKLYEADLRHWVDVTYETLTHSA